MKIKNNSRNFWGELWMCCQNLNVNKESSLAERSKVKFVSRRATTCGVFHLCDHPAGLRQVLRGRSPGLPSTHAGLALVVPAIWPLRQAQRAVCLAMVRRGRLLSLLSITISQVPTASWPAGKEQRAHCVSMTRAPRKEEGWNLWWIWFCKNCFVFKSDYSPVKSVLKFNVLL